MISDFQLKIRAMSHHLGGNLSFSFSSISSFSFFFFFLSIGVGQVNSNARNSVFRFTENFLMRNVSTLLRLLLPSCNFQALLNL